jgi:hypothetical protein
MPLLETRGSGSALSYGRGASIGLVRSGLVSHFSAYNTNSFNTNVFNTPLDMFSWFNTFGNNNITLSRDASAGPSPAGGTPMKMLVTGGDPHTGSYNQTSSVIANASNGQTWTVSFWAKASRAGMTVGPLISYNEASGGGFVFSGQLTSFQVPITTEWARYSGTTTAPVSGGTVTGIQVRWDINDAVTSNVGDIVWLDGLKVENGPTATAFNTNSRSTWFDISGNNNNATIVNGIDYGTSSVFQTSANGFNNTHGGYLQLDAANDYIQLASNGSAAPYGNNPKYSIEMWVNRYTESGRNYEIFWSQDYTSHTPPYYAVHIRIDNANAHGGIDYLGGSPFAYVDLDNPANPAFTNNQWNHFVFVRDDATGSKVYRNGVLRQDIQNPGTTTYYTNPLRLGWSNFVSSSALRFGEVRYYNRDLTGGEVAQNYNFTRSGYGL